jgi:hypothetical protein
MQRNIINRRSRIMSAVGCALIFATGASMGGAALTAAAPEGSVAMELIGQAQVLSPQAAIQYGYLTHVAGLDTVFAGAPENESTAVFSFYNDTVTTRVIDNGPLRIVNREGTATFYLNDTPGADFGNPDSFRAGLPVMTAHLTHQVVLDTVLNTFIAEFDLTIMSAEKFSRGGEEHRLGKPGEKLTWIVYGRANTAAPGFVLAGYVLSAGGKLK